MSKRKGSVILKQLVNEFWIPLAAAITWCIYNFTGHNAVPFQLSLLVSCFGAAFFFVSWLLSQYFRVRKQAKVDNDLQSIHENVSSVVHELNAATKDLIAYQTGGESYCYLMNGSLSSSANTGIETVIHQGKHPLFEVTARIVDLDEFDSVMSSKMTYDILLKTQRTYGNMIPGHVMSGKKWNLGDADQRRFNIFWTARNGSFTQCMRFKKINGEWQHATKVEREKVLFEHVSKDYPRNEEGQIIW